MLKMIISAAKTMVGVTVMLLAFTTTVSAQDRTAEGAKRATDKMKAELSLTDAQYPKVEKINKDFIAKTQENRALTNQVERENGVKALSEDRDTQLKAVLTEEQFKAYNAKKAARLNTIKERRAVKQGTELRKQEIKKS